MTDHRQSGPPGFPRQVWHHWRQVAHAIGVVQTRFVMVAIYALIVVPTGVVMRLTSDPLHLRPPEDGTSLPVHQAPRDLDSARRQF